MFGADSSVRTRSSREPSKENKFVLRGEKTSEAEK